MMSNDPGDDFENYEWDWRSAGNGFHARVREDVSPETIAMLSDVSSEAVAIYEKYAEEQITMITDEQATHMIAQLQEWARAKWGEPTYRYTVTHKQWDRRARSYMSRSKDCTFEEWRDNHKETDELYTRVIVGKYKPQWFAVYSRDIQKDGWPVELAKLVMGEATL